MLIKRAPDLRASDITDEARREQKLQELQGQLNKLLGTDIAMFNDKLRARGLSTIMVPGAKKTTSNEQQ